MPNKFMKLVANPMMNLDHIKRYSGTKLVEEESLSQHIVDTIMFGITMIDEINTLSPNELNPEIYVMKAVYHDLEEAITGDVPRPLKYYDTSTTSSLKNVAHHVAKDFFTQQFNNWEPHYQIWEYAKEGKEGYLLKLVDTLVVASKVVKEVSLLNNNYMLRVAHEVSQYLESLKITTRDNNYFNEEVTTYLLSIIQGAIDSMTALLDDHFEVLTSLNIRQQSMI